ncbi:MAG: hypothetical protein PHN74_01000 [Candidatus Pacebacteria bacterium]|nr:hypothetical protein [Candidatus Paceibacterota bacterium]
MKKKTLILVIVGVVLIGGAVFYGGMKCGQKSLTNRKGINNFSNLTDEQKQAGMQQFGGGAGFAGGGAHNGGGMVSGEIISKDDKGITVKLKDGGSKIVFIPESTIVTKNAAGSIEELKTGVQVLVSGTANTDGSVSAKSIQIIPSAPK